jgi:predicted DNA-binding transcriptional regulator AlpA
MRDITRLTGGHRSTIIRWIQNEQFPEKDAPYCCPAGWLRSTYNRWAMGSLDTPEQHLDPINK